jgi:hypothetical protein
MTLMKYKIIFILKIIYYDIYIENEIKNVCFKKISNSIDYIHYMK